MLEILEHSNDYFNQLLVWVCKFVSNDTFKDIHLKKCGIFSKRMIRAAVQTALALWRELASRLKLSEKGRLIAL